MVRLSPRGRTARRTPFDAAEFCRFTERMKSILAQLRAHVTAALATAFGAEAEGADPLVKPAGEPKFGDYQCNVAMGLAKKLGRKPRDVAQQVIDAFPAVATEMLAPPEIAGPGFINLRLKMDYLCSTLAAIPPAPEAAGKDRLGIAAVSGDDRQTVVIDYSSPNVAKQMHVGHLRSTIIGDTIARVLEFEGHDVIRHNHLGDWGTPMGMVLLAYHKRIAGDPWRRGEVSQHKYDEAREIAVQTVPLGELEDIYRKMAARSRERGGESGKVRDLTQALQNGDSFLMELWNDVREITLRETDSVYSTLGVQLDRDSIRGESFYAAFLPGVVEEIRLALRDGLSEVGKTRAVSREDDGALCVFFEQQDGKAAFRGPEGDSLPMIVQKTDGAYLYSTTDIAAILSRVAHPEKRPIRLNAGILGEVLEERGGGLGADRVLYVVGSPQKLHFEMLFATVRALGWTRPGDRKRRGHALVLRRCFRWLWRLLLKLLGRECKNAGKREVQLEHVSFGSVLGEDRKMLKTRTGDNVKLKDLLDEAVQRAEKLVRDTEADPAKRRGFDDEEIKQIAETVGIAAVKYADLSQNRNTDYVFSWDKMLALQGNTAPYMLYAYARIRSIYRKGAEAARTAISDQQSAVSLDHPAERDLALAVLRLAETIDAVANSLLPNILCEYLYDLAGRFMTFYESCPVLKAPDDATRLSRLRLCTVTARTLKLGLGLLGINTLERM